MLYLDFWYFFGTLSFSYEIKLYANTQQAEMSLDTFVLRIQ